jgi:DNA topoisomerase-1
MAKYLVVVESPAKSKTLEKYLGAEYKVLASYGHVRDLIPKEGAVNPDNDFAMVYQPLEKNSRHVDAICQALKTAEVLYLATDPDREGEAISWHLLELIKARKGLAQKKIMRVAFFEITRTAVKHAIANPRELNMELVHAQQARRALDYLVGFNISPLLWKKVRRGLSAGRVQSPALRMIVEREIEIRAFVAKEYWSLEADCFFSKKFMARLIEYHHEKLQQFSVTNASQAHEWEQKLFLASANHLIVTKVSKTQRKRHPAAPFTTSTLQQEAIRKLNFTASKAMRVAQQLYEGVDIGDGAVGLITYMRTDSVNLSQEALADIKKYITKKYGANNLPTEERVYKTKAKNAQEAHEAIRPTMIIAEPSTIKDKLNSDQYKLYSLIWKRTVASQMLHATFNQQSVDLACGEIGKFRANGSVIAELGFMVLYQEGNDEGDDPDAEKLLPELKVGDKIDLLKLRSEQHFTEPPPRFTEASLVKSLEEHGIGRPSTYATIISTLQQREYALLESKRFKPTDVGEVVSKFLTSYFPQYVDYNFTATLEDSLDSVSRGEKLWLPVLQEFWQPFIKLVKHVDETVQRKDVTQEEIADKCPDCNGALSMRLGKRGKFIGCNAYPECKYTRGLDGEETDNKDKELVKDRACPQCQAELLVRTGKFGKFIGCSAYPKCKFIESLDKPVETGVTCPECSTGQLIKRKSRFNSFFYSCSCYPDCKYALKYPPLDEKCPACSWPVLMHKSTQKYGDQKVCPQKECDFTADLEG